MKATMPLIEQVIDADARDDGSCVLPEGLLLGFIEKTGKWKHYDPKARDGSQIAAGRLGEEIDLRNEVTGESEDTVAGIFHHPVLASDIRRIAKEEAYRAMIEMNVDDRDMIERGLAK